MSTFTPSALANHHLGDLLSYLPDALDGKAEGIHQARVATRRLREVLPLLAASDAGHADTIRSAGRQLGRVRELDVMEHLIDELLRRAPADGASALLQTRQALWNRQRAARREMVKAVERLDLTALKSALASHGSGLSRWLGRDRGAERDWAQTLWSRILARSEAAADAAQRAPGIYLPQRAHQARIAVKKLRYAIEVATETGVWRPKRVLKDLRRLQQSLGEAHDAQVFLDSLDELLPDDSAGVGKALLKEALEREIERRHAEYSRRRQRVFAIAAACAHAAARSARLRLSRRVIAATALTAVPLVAAIQHAPGTYRRSG